MDNMPSSSTVAKDQSTPPDHDHSGTIQSADTNGPTDDAIPQPLSQFSLICPEIRSKAPSGNNCCKPHTCTLLYRRLPRRVRKLLWALFIFLAFSALFLLPFFFAPARPHSSANDLNFGRYAAGSPMGRAPFAGLLTAGVTPKRIHSHNDYTRAVPLFQALSHGCASVEADVWLVDGQLRVGHTEDDLTGGTLASMYVDPLVSLLDDYNAKATQKRGLFDVAPDLTLFLFIDIKSDRPSTFSAIHAALEALRSRNYLSTWNSSLSATDPPSYGPITVVGTGNTPFESVKALEQRDIFFDAPLDDINNPQYAPSVSPMSSGSFYEIVGFSWLAGGKGKDKVRHIVNAAHMKGIMTRFWATPSLPRWARNRVWSILLDAGVDFLNADDLAAVAAF